MEFFKYFWRALAGFRRRSLFLVVLYSLSGLLEGIVLIALIPIFNSGDPNDIANQRVSSLIQALQIDPDHIQSIAIATFIIFGLFSAGVSLWSEGGLLKLRTLFEVSLRKKISTALFKIKWSSFHSMRIGDINKAILMEPSYAAQSMWSFLVGVGALLTSLFFSVTAFFISTKMTMITIVFIAVIGFGYKLAEKKARMHAKKWSFTATAMSEGITEIFENLKYFKATGRARPAEEKTNDIYERHSRNFFWSQIFNIFMKFAYNAGGFLFLGGILSISLFVLKLPVVEVVVIMAVFYRMVPRIRTVQDFFYSAKVNQTWHMSWEKRYKSVRDSQDTGFGTETPYFENSMEIRDLNFAYPNFEKPVLKNLNLSLKKKQCVALVGESGSGKSTTIDLITGLLKPTSGEVSLDGVPLDKLDIDQWRMKIGLVMQESPVFHTTLLENIAWGISEPDEERAKHCAKLSHAWDFIKNLPEGLNTIVGEKGGRLSGGQKQRIALARALYRDPWLLILDEATSSLDGESEKIIQDSLNTLKGEFAIFMVAHRLKTVQMADEILVLSEGQILERGSWSELISRPTGAFRRMAELQGLVKPHEKPERV